MQYHLSPDYPNVGSQEIKAVSKIIRSKKLSSFSGKKVAQYEKRLCKYFEAKHAIAVSSGTAALHCALYAIDIGPGDEILVPATALVLTILPILFQNAIPVFVDTQENSFDFDYKDFRGKITSRTKAIMPVYLWGYPIDLKELSRFAKKCSLKIIEDAAQSHGSKYQGKNLGTIGDIGCFSTFESKLIATGEGGFILTNNDKYAKKMRSFIQHCMLFKIKYGIPRVVFRDIGWNYRISEITAAIGLAQIKKLPQKIKKRKENAQYLARHLSDLKEISAYTTNTIDADLNYFSLLMVTDNKWKNNKLAKVLYKLGIPSDVMAYNYRVCYDHPLFKKIANYRHTKCPNAKNLVTRMVNLPTYENLTKNDLNYIINSIKKIVK